MADRDVLLEALDDVDVDALVTHDHAIELANQLADALNNRGYALVLALPDEPHLVRIDDDSWIIQHPLHERLSGHLFECNAALVLDDFDEPDRGIYVLNDDGTIGDPVEQ